jgi:hypothetical protein
MKQLSAAACGLLLFGATAAGQQGRGAPPTGQAGARADFTGYWVSVVTEDWLWRMVTPPKGDVSSIPINAAGRKAAESWDLAKDDAAGNQCKAFGAAGLMRIPGRLHITWQDPDTLKIETDAGRQTRLLHFKPPAGPASRTPQGSSIASWETGPAPQPGGGSFGTFGAGAGGSLKVVTTDLTAGYLRKNGVPYSQNTVLTEYYDRHSDFGDEWFTVTSVVEDPQYLAQPFITSTHFKKEPDGAKWSPTPCHTDPPRGKE